jgi:hypothetical protein
VEGADVSVFQRARDAAAQAADQARQAAERASDAEHPGSFRSQARDAMGVARRGMKTVIERIDPSTLAEVVVRATALQELTNRALREKGSPYRISDISISASVPPGVTFSIGRVDDPEELGGQQRASTELAAESGVQILSLDGSRVGDPTDEEMAGAETS